MKIQERIFLHGREIQNRILFQPMEGCDGTREGGISELTRRRYLRFARGGPGIIWFEATAVCPEGRSNPRQLFLDENNVGEFEKLTSLIHSESERIFGYSPTIILQATHSGRYSKPNGTPEPVIAYHNAFFEKGKEQLHYKLMSDGECGRLPELYAHTAALAVSAGFDGIDVKCCHGYLLNEFLSAKERSGKYGGDLNGRSALFLDCFDAVKAAVPSNIITTTRLSAYDGHPYPYGFGVDENNSVDLTETKQLLSALQKRGAETVNVTIGNPYISPHINRPSVNGPEDGSRGVRRITKITAELQRTFPDLKIVLSGLSFLGTEAISYGEERLKNNECSFLGFGRETFAYPDFYKDFLSYGRLDKNKICLACGSCSRLMRAGSFAGCPVRDKEVYLPYFKSIAKAGAK